MNSLVIVRTPLRISFVGGGSDLPPGPGAVISSAIDKHVYCFAKRRLDRKIYLSWREREIVDKVKELHHEIVRAALEIRGWKGGIEVHFIADVPGVGSGLGSSAATTVSILHALAILQGWDECEVDSPCLADQAAGLNMERLLKSQGRQDEWACAVGGINKLKFGQGMAKVIEHKRLFLAPFDRRMLNEHFALFSPGPSDGRHAEEILKSFVDTEDFRTSCLELVEQFEAALETRNFSKLASLVHAHHHLKACGFTKYSPNASLNDLHYKLCGAGGTGHLLVGVTPETRREIVEKVEKFWGPELAFRFVDYGSMVIHRS
jgi:D-glycero-alpha-D-manno-heptose-7-phosphate kinase